MTSKPLLLIPVLALIVGLSAYQLVIDTPTYDVKTVSGDQFFWREKGEQWVVVNFFAQWCAPCLREIPELNLFHESLGENVEIFMVSYDPLTRDELEKLIKQYNIKPPVIVTNEQTRLPMAYPSGLPATFILSPNGEVVKTIMGEITAESLDVELKQAQLNTP